MGGSSTPGLLRLPDDAVSLAAAARRPDLTFFPLLLLLLLLRWCLALAN